MIKIISFRSWLCFAIRLVLNMSNKFIKSRRESYIKKRDTVNDKQREINCFSSRKVRQKKIYCHMSSHFILTRNPETAKNTFPVTVVSHIAVFYVKKVIQRVILFVHLRFSDIFRGCVIASLLVIFWPVQRSSFLVTFLSFLCVLLMSSL